MMQYAIFDVDGTLLDSMFIWEEAVDRTLRQKGIVPEEGLIDAIMQRPAQFSQIVNVIRVFQIFRSLFFKRRRQMLFRSQINNLVVIDLLYKNPVNIRFHLNRKAIQLLEDAGNNILIRYFRPKRLFLQCFYGTNRTPRKHFYPLARTEIIQNL